MESTPFRFGTNSLHKAKPLLAERDELNLSSPSKSMLWQGGAIESKCDGS
jgi:hypothetical protein